MKFSTTLKMAARGYLEAVSALNSLQSNYANIMAIRKSGDRKNQMNIWEMQEWSRRIGYNVTEFDKLNVVHITGTKGKGSTAAFVASILAEYKIPKIGLYTSPHLKSVRERIRINGTPISEELFAQYFFEVWDKLESTQSDLNKFPHMIPNSKPGYFKYLTLLSFHIFLQEGCDCCVYEVGVGGEYDSTNIVQRPLACGVTQLGIDHTFILGDTIQEIAWNKGGIFKRQSPAFTVQNQLPAGLKVLEERARERGTELKEVPVYKAISEVELGIEGEFQRTNASLAVALATQALASMYFLPSPVSTEDDARIPVRVLQGLEKTRWDGRCQVLERGHTTWFIDGAHTKESIEAASDWFAKRVKSSDKKKVLLFNQQSRDANALLSNLYDKTHPYVTFDCVIFTTNVTWKTGDYSADLVSMNTSKEQVDNLEVQNSLAQKWVQIDGKRCETHVTASIEEACGIIENFQEPLDVFVTGSLHLVGGLLVVFDKA
ncbi:MET7 (YOR241W) [Zygosaccharomyces parabailii]|nr:MET7 (YOR241W) [Zygosaccharomyces parabailii]